jgi:hypothetical protein
MLKRKKKKSEEGMAILEAIPVVFMLALIFNFSLGFFGAIHSGILNSIASYNYSLETFRFRSNLMYFRPGGGTLNYLSSQARVHGTVQDGSEDQGDSKLDAGKWPATLRGITFNYKSGVAGRDLSSVQEDKNSKSAVTDFSAGDREFKKTPSTTSIWSLTSESTPQNGQALQTPRIWVKTVYGMCLNADCEKKQ